MAPRLTTVWFLVWLSALSLVVASCSDEGAPVDNPSELGPLEQLAIAPDRPTLTVRRGGTATVALRVAGRYRSGAVRELTSRARWSVDGVGASVPGGAFSATAPGLYTVTVNVEDRVAQTLVTVRGAGELLLPGVPTSARGALSGGVPSGAPPATVAYPLEGAIIPANLGEVEVHALRTDPSQSLVKVTFSGTLLDLELLGECRPIRNAPLGCAITVDSALIPWLTGASEGETMNLRVRLSSPDGASRAESAPREVRWAAVNVTGALYYWSTRLGDGSTAIYRYNLATPRAGPEAFFLQSVHAPEIAGRRPCVGCHAISRDGRRLALSFGGSDPASFGLYDIATRRPIATRLGASPDSGPPTFAAMSALSPDGERLITILRGSATLRQADASLSPLVERLFSTGLTPGDLVTQPYWSSDGRHLTFVGWNPGMYDCNSPPCGDRLKDNGDLAPYGQVYVADVEGDRPGAPRLLVPRSTTNGGRDFTSHYPAISDDSRWVVFNRVHCSARGNDQGYANDRAGSAANCSGYDNPGARVALVPFTGGAPVDLARLNGTDTWTNSWPRWAPNHGRFRGSELYWVAFSSKRPYGLRLPGDPTGRAAGVSPQLWLAAITLGSGDAPTGDPSHAPVWLPGQNADENTPSGNHVPQWVAVFVPTPG